MIPTTPEELKLKTAGRSLTELCYAVVVALPDADTPLVALVAGWLTDDTPSSAPPLTTAEVEAIWLALQVRETRTAGL